MVYYVGGNSVLFTSCFRLISKEVPDYMPNILWICFHLFELGDLQRLGSNQFFIPYRSIPLITITLEILPCLFFQHHRFLDVCAKFSVYWLLFKCFIDVFLNFMLIDFYLSLLFNFKIGLLLGLSCLMSSVFINILIIRIIKKTCFDNTILMA